ncbi:DgyrCDS13535 [Dimorphilus gyrociliatus]|uniref:Choline transporter-like protein n=1 Tax=Dimorphilus gyrociliatus TaxID=2664684 RepID=A0A7I8WAW8_9ANNE|nr:DgyrCDS13535 [Dimorphilus gyrociliatus]
MQKSLRNNRVQPENEAIFVSKRSCTDILCLLLFLCVLGGMAYIAYIANLYGHPLRIIYGQDSYGNTCNVDNTPLEEKWSEFKGHKLSGINLKGYNKVYFYNFRSIFPFYDEIPGTIVCVRTCPENITNVEDHKKFSLKAKSSLCRYDVNNSRIFNGDSEKDRCPPLPLTETIDILNRCVPRVKFPVSVSVKLSDACNLKNDILENLLEALNDIRVSWFPLLMLLLIGLAMKGVNFCQGAGKAFSLLLENPLRAAVINGVGWFVLFVGKILVAVAVLVIGIFGFNIAVDTIFLCFCLDCRENDGDSKPYFMSLALMKFSEDAKKAIELENQRSIKRENQNVNAPTNTDRGVTPVET